MACPQIFRVVGRIQRSSPGCIRLSAVLLLAVTLVYRLALMLSQICNFPFFSVRIQMRWPSPVRPDALTASAACATIR